MTKLPPNAKNIAGQKFAMLTAVEYCRSQDGAVWKFTCECGEQKELKASQVVGGHQKSCGCLGLKTRFSGEGLVVGSVINGVTLVENLGRSGHNIKWECLCKCGETFAALASNLRSGNTTSCGCHKRATSAAALRTHGMSETPTWYSWSNMLRRCTDPKNEAYSNYGGRGITVCERWFDFASFLADMGERADGMTLERERNHEGYSPDNCKWATRKKQNRNQRSNHLLTVSGVTKVLAEWAEISGVSSSLILHRKNKLGWSDERLLAPPKPKPKRN